MKLKRVKIFGFKTFADRTEFDLSGDIIAIVGPNGCGKSNIVDAILWALGESKASQLRAGNGQDVIFSGSSKRKPLGYAEVTLTFDNEDSSLPIAAAEVVVSRKLTRAGDSQFTINKRNCRLKDIYDLLADSGLGRSGYSIVGQREIDQALSASPEDRRAWIDEAAGVQRFRAKRQESIRRLEEAAVHLQRVDGILTDIEAQREPLESEASAARVYLGIKDQLSSIETAILLQEMNQAQQTTLACTAKIAEALERSREELKRSDTLEDEAKQIGEHISELERRLDALRELRQTKLTAVERAESSISLAEQKLASLDELEASLQLEEAASVYRIQESQADLEAAESAHSQRLEELEALRTSIMGSGAESKRLTAELAAIDEQIRSTKDAESNRLRLIAERDQAIGRSDQLVKEVDSLDRTLPDLDSAAAEAEVLSTELETKLQSTAAEHKSRVDRVRELEELDSESARQARSLMSERASLDGRRRGLEATLDAHDGLAHGALAVMNLIRSGELDIKAIPAAEAISTKSEFSLAIETALGGAANDLIVDSDREAKAAIALLKDRKLGRATFQPRSMIRPSRHQTDLQKLTTDKAVIGIASELVECISEHRPIFENLLGRILIISSIDDAIRLSKTSGWNRLVTLDGEVVHSSGAVTGGRQARQTSGILQRKSELADVELKLVELDEQIAAIHAESSRRSDLIAFLRPEIETLRTAQSDIERELKEHQNWASKLDSELTGAKRERERLTKELDLLQTKISEPIPEVQTDSAAMIGRDAVLSQIARHSNDQEKAKQRMEELEAACGEARDRVKESKRRLHQANEHAHQRTLRLEGAGSERQHLAAKIASSKNDRDDAVMQASDMVKELDAAAHERKTHLERAYKLGEDAKEAQKNASISADAARTAEVDKSRAESRRANAVQRLIEEYGISEEEASEMTVDQEIPEDAPGLVSKLRRELRSLGTVNLGAIDAYDRLTERFEELSAQRNDVTQSKEEIEGAIRELDRLTRDKFLDAFEQVRVKFSEYFQRLFNGGEAVIELTKSDSILTSGVNIEAAVPGKRKQRLELLSGGERSLCACAFLFALLSVRSSPLVVLDEVDAPLDGRNVERFIEVLASFKGRTQFVVITHNPVTIEAAPMWFGVTMQEPGVTSVLSMPAPGESELVSAVVHDRFLEPESSRSDQLVFSD